MVKKKTTGCSHALIEGEIKSIAKSAIQNKI